MDVLYKPYEDLLHRVDFQEKHSFDKYEVIALCLSITVPREKKGQWIILDPKTIKKMEGNRESGGGGGVGSESCLK